MNPGPVEEVGQTARSFFDVMRGQPFLLSMILTNAALIVLLYFQATHAERERTESLRLLYENRKFVGELLARHCDDGAKP